MASLAINLWICGGVAFSCWAASVVTREYSWVDRLWSVIPVVYLWVFVARAGDVRGTLVAGLVTLWGVRLMFNFARRGGYAPGGEDCRRVTSMLIPWPPRRIGAGQSTEAVVL